MKHEFMIQMKATLVISRTIRAESMEEALESARQIALGASTNFVSPRKGWTVEYDEGNEVTGVLS